MGRRATDGAVTVGRVDRERLSRLLGTPELSWLVERVRRRVELGQPANGTVTLRAASPGERAAVVRLLGRPARAARGVSVSLREVDELLRRSAIHPDGLVAAVEALTGPITVRADRIATEEHQWAAAFERVEAVAGSRPALAAWLAGVRASGLVKRLAGSPHAGRELLDALAAVVAALPAAGGESLSAFAARVADRAHALDDGAPLGTLALGAARAIAGIAPPEPGESPFEARREAWAAVGVLCDELSSTVLTLRLPGDGSATGRVLDAGHGEPLWLTLRQLVRCQPSWTALDAVLVVENPSVIALAADTASSPPLVCTNGQPRAAAMVLLRRMAADGVRILHHGDFDWPGIAIGNLLHRRLPVEPCRFDRRAYLAAVASHPHAGSLHGPPVAASWDASLAPAMREASVQVEEELVASELLRLAML
jgi:uncharacterized protein (TIGR02679 family)